MAFRFSHKMEFLLFSQNGVPKAEVHTKIQPVTTPGAVTDTLSYNMLGIKFQRVNHNFWTEGGREGGVNGFNELRDLEMTF